MDASVKLIQSLVQGLIDGLAYIDNSLVDYRNLVWLPFGDCDYINPGEPAGFQVGKTL